MTEPTLHRTIPEDVIAEPWRRLAGFVIDWTILVMITLMLMSVFQFDLEARDDFGLPASARIVQGITVAVYYIGFTMSRGQTPGKMLTGTMVLVETTAQIPGLGPSALRWIVPGIFVFLPGVSVIFAVIYGWMVFDDRRRGLHDKAAKTVVVRVR